MALILISLLVIRAMLVSGSWLSESMEMTIAIVAIAFTFVAVTIWMIGWYKVFAKWKYRIVQDNLVYLVFVVCFGPLGAAYIIHKGV